MNTLRDEIEKYLSGTFLDSDIPGILSKAMRYSLLAGGKRLRPMLFLSFARCCQPNKSDEITQNLLPFAAALEMIHTYSLIHDDLPAMDDDDLRRGLPTCHKAFDEATAILAGDALLTNAFQYMTSISIDNPALLIRAIQSTAISSGASGMVGGQVLDLQAEGKHISIEELNLLNAKKTGALILNACKCGAILANGTEKQIHAAEIYGSELGIAFQITDDILDVIGDEKIVGKEVRHDAESQKSTWPALLGLDASIKQAEIHCAAAINALEGIFFGADAEFLRSTAQKLVHRTH